MQATLGTGTRIDPIGRAAGSGDGRPDAAALASAARRLLLIAGAGGPSISLPRMENGFRELAGLARGCGEARVVRISRAFASILGRAGNAPEGDLPFILDMASAYLESLPSRLRPAAEEARA